MKIKPCYSVFIYLFGTVVTQSCFLSGDPNSMASFSNQGRGSARLPSDSQVIVTSYQFQCCGRVTRWQAYVEPGGNKHRDRVYSIRFQVWRPGPAVESDGCYSLVGEDRYENIYLDGHGLVQRDMNSSTALSFQPGDVVGYYVSSTKGQGVNDGIQLKTDSGGESVWYGSGMDGHILVASGVECDVSVGSQSDRDLSSFTSMAPVFSIETVSSSCAVPPISAAVPPSSAVTAATGRGPLHTSSGSVSPSPVSDPPSSTLHTSAQDQNAGVNDVGISEATLTRTHAWSLASTPTTFSPSLTSSTGGLDLEKMAIIAGVCALAVLVVTLAILAAAIVLYRWKITRLTEIYSHPHNTGKKDDLRSIKTTINESYGANTITTVHETLKCQKISHTSSSRGGPTGTSEPYYAVLTPNDHSSATGPRASQPYYAVLTPNDHSSVTGQREEEYDYEYPSY